MIENFEFSDTKQVRKTLLISSFAGICFKVLVKHSTGSIEFLGFKIPVEDASIIPSLVGFLIIYEIIVLIIRYSDEDLRERYKLYKEYIEKYEANPFGDSVKRVPFDHPLPSHLRQQIVKKSVTFIDILFPILFGFFALYKIFIH